MIRVTHGDLIGAAQREGFAGIVARDQNIRHQRRLMVRPLAFSC